MCINLIDRANIARMTGNPKADDSWVRTRLLSLLATYPELVQEAVNLGAPLTHTVDEGEDAGVYLMRRGLRAPLRKKMTRLLALSIEVANDIYALPKSGDAHIVSAVAQGGVRRGRRDDQL